MIRTDDTAPLHSKFQQAGLLAYGWWHAALSYCGRQLTDGFIPARDFPLIFPAAPPKDIRRAIEALVREGCLHKVDAGQRGPCPSRRGTCPTSRMLVGGVILHDYFDFQERAASARLRRRNLSTYGRQGGMKSGKTRRAKASSQVQADPPLLSVPILSVPIRTTKEGRSNGHVVLADDQFLNDLVPLYPGVDVSQEANKLRAWLLTPKGHGKQFTRRRFVNWLNRVRPSDDPYRHWPHLYDCARCGGVHDTPDACAPLGGRPS